MKKTRVYFILGIVSLVWCSLCCPATAADAPFDKFGGWTGLAGTQTGAFHVEEINGRWWIVTPAGHVFWSTGVYSVRMSGIPETGTDRRPYKEACLKKYGSEREWARVTRLRLNEWGFNTIGDWSSETIFREPGFAYVAGIDLPRQAPNVIAPGAYGYFPDVFDPSFAQSVQESVRERFARQPYLVDDPWLLGYFLADEPSWYGSKQRHGALTDDFIRQPADSAGKKAWVEYLTLKYKDISALNQAWDARYKGFDDLLAETKLEDKEATAVDKKAFLKAIALQFARVLFETVRQVDPHHMILGTRPSRKYPEILSALGEYTDVFSLSAYELNEGYKIADDYEEKVANIYSLSGKPLLLGVIIPAKDTGLPYGVVKTQADRGVSYWRYLARVAADPRVVGVHWFQYFDPPKKCYDKMAANWGLVNQADEPYTDAVSLIAQANHMVYAYALGVASFSPPFAKGGPGGDFIPPSPDAAVPLPASESAKNVAEVTTPPSQNEGENSLPPRASGGAGGGEVPQGDLSYLTIPIPNAGFEDRDRGWKFQAWKGQSRTAIDDKIKHSGKYALRVTGGPDEGWESVGTAVRYNPAFLIKPNLKYKLSAWIKTEKVENFAQVRVKVTRDDGTSANYEAGGAYGTTDWTYYETTFSASGEVKVDYLLAQMVGLGQAWFDDIQLQVMAGKGAAGDQFVRAPEPPPAPQDLRMLRTQALPLTNSDFEKGDRDWGLQQWKGKPKVSVPWFKGHDSLRALEVKGSADGWDSVGVAVRNISALTLDPERRYLLRGWIRTADVTGQAMLRIKVKYQDGGDAYFETTPVTGTTDWTETFVIFQLPKEGTPEYLACQLIGQGTAWFDNLAIEEIF